LFGGKSTPATRAILSPNKLLSLPLLVLRVFADHPYHAFTVDYLALIADLFY
jgi:hypothetical protein